MELPSPASSFSRLLSVCHLSDCVCLLALALRFGCSSLRPWLLLWLLVALLVGWRLRSGRGNEFFIKLAFTYEATTQCMSAY
jgi:hypothetical protein